MRRPPTNAGPSDSPVCPAGTYRISVPDADIFEHGLKLDGRNRLRLELGQPPPPTLRPQKSRTWRVVAEDGGASPGFGIIRASVEGLSNLPVQINAAGWVGYSRRTGSKSEYGPFFLEFAPLGSGRYFLTPSGLDIVAEVHLDASRIAIVRFLPTTKKEAATAQSAITGKATGGAGMTVVLHGPNDLAREQRIGADETFLFADLGPGVYTVLLSGPGGDISETVELDGENSIDLTLDASAASPAGWTFAVSDGGPSPGFAVVRVRCDNQPDLPVRMWTSGWQGIVRRIGDKREYGEFVCEFAPLGSGVFYVEPEGLGVQARLELDGSRVVWVTFSPGTAAGACLLNLRRASITTCWWG